MEPVDQPLKDWLDVANRLIFIEHIGIKSRNRLWAVSRGAHTARTVNDRIIYKLPEGLYQVEGSIRVFNDLDAATAYARSLFSDAASAGSAEPQTEPQLSSDATANAADFRGEWDPNLG